LLVDGGPDRTSHIGLYTFADGQLRWIGHGPDGVDYAAGVSPDGRRIAALCSADNPAPTWTDDAGNVVISLIDVSTGHRQRIWSGPVGRSFAEDAVSWSPDGARIAMTYGRRDDDSGEFWHATVVVDPSGRELGHFDGFSPQSNGAWINERELLVTGSLENDHLAIIDVETGIRRVVEGYNPLAAIGDRLLAPTEGGTGIPLHLSLYTLAGADPQPFIATDIRAFYFRFDIAPQVA
jgi:hypothetical protein